jgi:hypothetical protein
MAAISGTGGKVSLSTSTGDSANADLIVNVTQWTMNIDAGLIDVNAFGSTWRKAIPGLRGGTGSVQGFWEMTDADQAKVHTLILNGAQGTVVLYTDSANGNGYYGDAYVGGLQVGAQLDNAVSMAFDFTFNGAVAYSTTLA